MILLKRKQQVLIHKTARVDGLIISLAKETQQKNDFTHIKKVINYGIPEVLFDRVSTELSCDCISIDDKK